LALVRGGKAFGEQYDYWQQQDEPAIRSAAKALHAEARSFVRRRRNLEDDLSVLAAYEEVVQALLPMVQDQALPEDYDFLGVVFERRNRNARQMFERELRKLTAGQCLFQLASLSRGRAAALVGYQKSFSREVGGTVSRVGVSEVRGPRYLRDRPFREALGAIQADLEQLTDRRTELQERMNAFFQEKGSVLLALQSVCTDRFNRLEVVKKFARTQYAFIIEGWVPTDHLAALQSKISSRHGKAVVMRELPAQAEAPRRCNYKTPQRSVRSSACCRCCRCPATAPSTRPVTWRPSSRRCSA
jgi:vacuolar-type H+-ATPase subunit I/STV1